MPTPLRTPQTSGHSSFRVSNLPLWSLKSPPSHGSKIIFFHLSQSKCTVSALFLHGFKGCNGHSDLQNTTKGSEIAGRKITMLCTKNDVNSKLLKSECSARWALLIRGPGIRVPTSAPKTHEGPQGFSWVFLCSKKRTGRPGALLCVLLFSAPAYGVSHSAQAGVS